MSLALIEAANVGLCPCKYGGVFGQELSYTNIDNDDVKCTNNLTTEVEQWKPSRQGDVLQDVRKATVDLSKLASRRNGEPFKLPVTILSGFLGKHLKLLRNFCSECISNI